MRNTYLQRRPILHLCILEDKQELSILFHGAQIGSATFIPLSIERAKLGSGQDPFRTTDSEKGLKAKRSPGRLFFLINFTVGSIFPTPQPLLMARPRSIIFGSILVHTRNIFFFALFFFPPTFFTMFSMCFPFLFAHNFTTDSGYAFNLVAGDDGEANICSHNARGVSNSWKFNIAHKETSRAHARFALLPRSRP